jgi:hypothetical protein
MPSPRALDASPLSEFVTKMREMFRRRLAAIEPQEQHAIEHEMETLMWTCLGRSAWEAAVDAEHARNVSRATSVRRRVLNRPRSRYAADSVDRKLAAAGPDED